MMLHLFGLIFLLAGLADSSFAQNVRELHFAPGASSVVVSDAVVRGSQHCFAFSARKGQWAQISVSAVESNAAITVWRPGARAQVGGSEDIEGTALPGAGEGQDASQWKGRLPESGRYLIVVGPTRGNASYELRLAIGRRPLPALAPAPPRASAPR